MTALIDLTGKRFGKLVVVSRAENIGREVAWNCKCDCGNETIVRGNCLRRGSTKSCGCGRSYKIEKGAPIDIHAYRKWYSMRCRCYKPCHKMYPKYGGRGIVMCDEWRDDYLSFERWLLSQGWKHGSSLSVDRIDNDGPYSPENCRLATALEQGNNRRTNVWIEFKGEKHTLEEWSRITGINHNTIRYRLNSMNLSVEEAITRPIGNSGPKGPWKYNK